MTEPDLGPTPRGTSRLRVLFMGSPDFAVPSLEALCTSHDVVAVVTQPDRPRGRGRSVAAPPVKDSAEKLDLPVLQPEKLRRRHVREELTALKADLFVVVAYGKILSKKMLVVPPMGCVNVHASILPRLRGAAPIHWTVIRGETESGISVMKMDEGMDTGPILLQESLPLRPDETAGSLHDRLAPLGAKLLLRAISGLCDGSITPCPQPAEGTLAPMLRKEDGEVDFGRPAREVDCHIRGMDPWPGAYTFLDGGRLKLFRSRAVEGVADQPGVVLGADSRGLLVACGGGAVRIRELQLPGRRRLDISALMAGHSIPPGTLLGQAPG